MRKILRLSTLVYAPALLLQCTLPQNAKEDQKPNIVIIYTDDLGYGDIGANGAIGVKTSNIDRLAKEGVNFTDAHCSASTCTPSRYSLLTGSYAFRRKAAVLPGDAPLLIDTQKETLPSMLKEAGYKTAVVGKWHLGIGNGRIDWNNEIKPGPKEVGFDYSFIIPATNDRVPCVFVENGWVVGLEKNDPIQVDYNHDLGAYPTGVEHPEMLRIQCDLQHKGSIINGISRIGYMSGGKNALWVDQDFSFTLTNKAKTFISENKDHPFFLYFALPNVHEPRTPNPMFKGESTMGDRGDDIAEMDWCIGQLVKQIEALNLSGKTLIIFSSDNGPILHDGYEHRAIELVGNHKPAGPYRGAKYSIYEAGTRMPTIVYWPGHVSPKVSTALLSQVDLYASLAKLVGHDLRPGTANDSQDHLDAWLGRTNMGRDVMLEEGYTLGLRKGEWKYIMPQRDSTPEWLKNKDVETGLSDKIQLFNLRNDIGETKNIASENPKIVKEMKGLLQKIQE